MLNWLKESVRMDVLRCRTVQLARVIDPIGRQRMNGRHVDVERIAILIDGIIQRSDLSQHGSVVGVVSNVGATVVNPLLRLSSHPFIEYIFKKNTVH